MKNNKSTNQNNLEIIYKERGETPLEALEKLRLEKNISRGTKMTYAGRLDPMAEGVMILLINEETKNKEKYLKLDKEYIFELVLGIETDTLDFLGQIVKVDKNFDKLEILKKHKEENIKNYLESLVGKHTQEYPAYSSKKVAGKQLFDHAKEGTLESIEVPKKEIEIKNIKLIRIEKIKVEDRIKESIEIIKKINGDFRQEDIIKKLEKFGEENKNNNFTILKIKVVGTSGMYVRVLAQKIAFYLKTYGIADKIVRVKVGDFV